MNNFLTDFFKRNSGIILAILIGLEAVYLRIYFSEQVVNDYTYYLNPWIQFIREHGFLNAFQFRFSEYAPLYLHVLATLSLFITNNLLVVKTASWIFEGIAVIYVFKLLTHFGIDNHRKWILSALFLLLPTVLMNGSYWAQCDIIYGSMILASLYYLLKKKLFLSYLFLGIAFSFKLQTIFIIPLYFLTILIHQKTWKYALLVPGIYLVSIFPSFIAGRSLHDLLTIYASLANPNDPLVQNATNVYQLIPYPEDNHELLSTGGIWFSAILVMMLCVTLYLKNKRSSLSTELTLNVALMFALVVPYFLPHMHDRYFFLADILSFLFVILVRRYYFIPVIIIYASLQSYLAYLKGFAIISPANLSLLTLLVLTFVVFLAYRNKPSIR